MQSLLFSFRQVFSDLRYIALSVTTFLLVLTFAIWLPNINFLLHTATSDLFSFSEKAGIIGSVFVSLQTNFTPLSRSVTILISLLFSINLSLLIYFFIRVAMFSKEAGISTSGFLIGIIAVGCASCGSVILSSLLGVGATAVFIGVLPLKGQEFGLFSIILLSLSIYLLSKKINNPLVCNTTPRKINVKFSIIPKWAKFSLFIFLAFIIGTFTANKFLNNGRITSQALAVKFEMLSQNGNSSCTEDFMNSISSMPDGSRLQSSCCSPMNNHRYSEQIEGLRKYKNIKEIPSDPYDVDAKLAKKLKSYYDDNLNPEQQKVYDYAMQNSMEKGPCCCKCWRWYVYGGLAKYLIQNYNFTGEQITEIWNLSDGCGGAGDHVNH